MSSKIEITALAAGGLTEIESIFVYQCSDESDVSVGQLQLVYEGDKMYWKVIANSVPEGIDIVNAICNKLRSIDVFVYDCTGELINESTENT